MARTKHVPRIRPDLAPNDNIMPSTNVPSLPEEILQLIIEHLDLSRLDLLGREEALIRKALVALCLASKQCLRMAQHLLYRTIRFDIKPDILDVSKSLACHPHLAGLVRGLRVGDWDLRLDEDGEPEDGQDEANQLPQTLMAHYEQALESLRPIRHPAIELPLLEALELGQEDAHLAFIILHCRNLEMLSLTIPYGFEQSWVSAIPTHTRPVMEDGSEQPSTSTTQPLMQLKEFRAEHWDTENATTFNGISHFARLPGLPNFFGFAIDLTQEEQEALRVEPYDLRDVQLQYSIVDAEGLRRLLQCCASLTSLSIEWGGATVGDCELKFDQISAALTQQGKGLEFLEFILADDISLITMDDQHPPLGSLKALTSLKKLHVPAVALFGEGIDESGNAALHDILPEPVEKLHVTGWGIVSHFEDKEARFDEALSRLPHLRTVTFQGETPNRARQLKRWWASLAKQQDGTIVRKIELPPME